VNRIISVLLTSTEDVTEILYWFDTPFTLLVGTAVNAVILANVFIAVVTPVDIFSIGFPLESLVIIVNELVVAVVLGLIRPEQVK
jgi:hypothetical protein